MARRAGRGSGRTRGDMLPGIRDELRAANRRRVADLLGISVADLGRLKGDQAVTRRQLAAVTRKTPTGGKAPVVPIEAATGKLRRQRYFPVPGLAKRTIHRKGGK